MKVKLFLFQDDPDDIGGHLVDTVYLDTDEFAVDGILSKYDSVVIREARDRDYEIHEE